ncbi:hypothetical protein D3H65_03000 [Paraflavitalea soli]|uniref:Carbohydrate-binding domain-containing protein n=1 Tax=Paraflavitalea soli TaxID=2315862 RepID=A0A3B7MF88_9BACT|nr:carbohydrate-binding family 9-like protein [Paraflavitalea soli]AXY72998.1 hypothetical protein D3H65_03000 [Paraflavitalea soli]
MKQLTVPHLSIKDPQDMQELDRLLNALPRQLIAEVPWQDYPYKPAVEFVIGYHESYLFLKYFVAEKAIRAVANQVNGKVWEDSCVEFFISFDDVAYYNLEFNCIGTSLIGFGPSKSERNMLPAPIVEQIVTHTAITRQPAKKLVQWELTIAIPVTSFIHHQPLTLSGRQCRANFYKCGDQLPEPHFVSWRVVDSATPNFHVPASFGSLRFE